MQRHWRLLMTFLFASIVLSVVAQDDQVVLVNLNKNSKEMRFSYWTTSSNWPVGAKTIRASGILNDGNVVTLPTDGPIFLNFSQDFKIQLVCLFPGDTLEFRKTDDMQTPIRFTGTRPEEELMFYSKLEALGIGLLNSNNNIEVSNRLDFDYVVSQSEERYKAGLEALQLTDVSSQGRMHIGDCLYYRYLSDLLFPYRVGKSLEELQASANIVPAPYQDMLLRFKDEMNKPSMMYSIDYKRFIRYFARFLWIRSSPDTLDVKSMLTFYKVNFEGKVRDLLLYDEVISNYSHGGELLISEVAGFISNHTLVDTLNSINNRLTRGFNTDLSKVKLEIFEGETITFNELLSQHSGRNVYLDFWATWCAPCLMEMPDSEKLTIEFADAEIDFVYLSIDKDRDKWIRKVKTLSTSAPNTQYLRIVDGEAFISKEGIPSIPRYIFLDRQGNVVNFDAPRPGSEKLRMLFGRYVLK